MKYLNQVRKYGARVVAGGSVALLPLFAHATAGPYDAITDAVDFASVVTAVGVIAGLLALAFVAKKGARMVLSMIK